MDIIRKNKRNTQNTMKPKTFSEVQNFLSSINNINYGGCGIAVIAMYRWLKKNNQLGINVYFYYLYDRLSKNRYDNNYKALCNENLKPDTCAHAVLYYNGQFIDCNGVHDVTNYDLMQKISNENFILKSINNYSEWNSKFYRNVEVKRIQKALNIKMSDIKID